MTAALQKQFLSRYFKIYFGFDFVGRHACMSNLFGFLFYNSSGNFIWSVTFWILHFITFYNWKIFNVLSTIILNVIVIDDQNIEFISSVIRDS